MPDNYTRSELDTPSTGRRHRFFSVNADAIGIGAEKVARFLGTGRYLLWQTVIVVVWIALNIGGLWWSWDPYPFILLNLAFSTQAAYAAPLILLAQNRQDDRDRVSLNEDRRRAAETKADTEFLARELAGVRIAVGDTVTRDYLRHELDDLTDLLNRIEDKLEDQRHEHRTSETGARLDSNLDGSRDGSEG
ncbi:DUF1003 domain-containing protein [Corynebacterium nuruki]|uniref:DUF1003 domain-containing protein n=1 Tax=Corynebacterium nuruki TaxID=1032851 RepID=UPI0039BF9406